MPESQSAAATHDFLIRGRDYLERFEQFELVGREDILTKLTGVLIRQSANSVLLVGVGGVGCSAICLGLQASKEDEDTPFDLVSKRFFWLDADLLFASGDQALINTEFNRILRRLERTPNSVLVLDDMRDFIDASRNSGCTNLINALMYSVKLKKFQLIMEARDDDLQIVLSCHSDMQESYTLLDIPEPDEAALGEIISTIARTRLKQHHRINISECAIEAAIEVTTKYGVQDLGLSRAQPERTLTLLDRALTTYRLNAHARDPRLAELLMQVANMPDEDHHLRDELEQKIEQIEADWAERQREIKRIDAELRDGQEAIRELELEIEQQQQQEQELLQQDTATGTQSRKKEFVPFAARTAAAGYDSEAVTELRQQIAKFQKELDDNQAVFEKLTGEVNDQLLLQREQVLEEFSNISGIPVTRLTQDERAKLLHLDENLKQHVFGQDHAVEGLANQVRVAKAGLQSPNKPQASFMFLGPSGVGKTELAKALTVELFDDERALLRFDMSEYMEKHAVAKLIGAPPGYEGYEAGGILTNEMRRNPRRIILFDEIEKAHADIFNVFLQILDDARLTDNRGLTVSFRDSIILMTTNIGTSHFLSEPDFDVANKLALADLTEQYRPEFLARFNGRRNIICFNTLSLDVIEKIAVREIKRLNEMVQRTNPDVIIEMEAGALRSMCEDHYEPSSGARGITGYVEGVLKPQIANTVLFDEEAKGTIRVEYDHDSRSIVVHAIDR